MIVDKETLLQKKSLQVPKNEGENFFHYLTQKFNYLSTWVPNLSPITKINRFAHSLCSTLRL
jgi:hypothetical protein